MDKIFEKTQFVLSVAANNYGGITEINKLLEDSTVSEEDIRRYMKYCEKVPTDNVKNVDSWRKFEQMKHIAKTKGIEKIMFRKDVHAFTKFTTKYQDGEEVVYIRIATDYGNFAISANRFITDC